MFLNDLTSISGYLGPAIAAVMTSPGMPHSKVDHEDRVLTMKQYLIFLRSSATRTLRACPNSCLMIASKTFKGPPEAPSHTPTTRSCSA